MWVGFIIDGGELSSDGIFFVFCWEEICDGEIGNRVGVFEEVVSVVFFGVNDLFRDFFMIEMW